MCGRYVTKATAELERFWNITRGGIAFGGIYNAAPTQNLPIIRLHQGGRALALMRWGLVPSSAKARQNGREPDQRTRGNRRNQARVSRGVQEPALPGPDGGPLK